MNHSPILLIGGTDPSGAGLQTDWKVVHAMNIHANSIVTAVTAQNDKGLIETGLLTVQHVKAEIKTVFYTNFSAIKIGMLGNEGIIRTLLDCLDTFEKQLPIILDPVLATTSGGKLLTNKGCKLLLSKLLPRTALITPNLFELGLLTGLPVSNHQQMQKAAKYLLGLGANAVLVKGGHFIDDKESSNDFFISHDEQFYLSGSRWSDRKNVRGTGCALATAITSFIARGCCLTDAIINAKALLSKAIRLATKEGDSYQLFINAADKLYDAQDYPKLIRSNFPEPKAYNFPSCGSKNLGIYPVVDSLKWLKKLVPLRVETIQLRIKDKREDEVEADIKAAIEFCKDYSTRLFINDYWRLAVKYQAYGIHLGQEDVETADLQAISDAGCRLGLSTHSFTEVARAHAIQSSYLALGPIFPTTSKDMPWIPQGVEAVEGWVKLFGSSYPLVAIGGINTERARLLKQTQVGSVAMISAITESSDYKESTLSLLSNWKNSKN